MTPYAIGLFLHFVGMVGLFVGFGLEWTATSLLRRAATSDQARAWLRIYKLSMPISGPGLLLLIITGGYLASVTGSMKQGWISAALLAIVFALGLGFVFILPRVRTIRAGIPDGTAPLSESALARMRDPMVATLVRVRLLLALGIVYLMTSKPQDLSTGLFILLGAIVVGLLCAIGTWTSQPAPGKA